MGQFNKVSYQLLGDDCCFSPSTGDEFAERLPWSVSPLAMSHLLNQNEDISRGSSLTIAAGRNVLGDREGEEKERKRKIFKKFLM